MPFYLYKSNRKNKRYVMVMPEFGHSHHFSDTRYENYTMHKDPERAERYRKRHAKDPIDDVHSPGSLAYYITWSAPTLERGIRNYEKKFGVKVVNRTNQTYKK
tara:strand:- start:518 stop:826 length:309 start_codon:yes stop_codon:yes gene_type:complete